MKVVHVIIILVKNHKQEWDAYCETPRCLKQRRRRRRPARWRTVRSGSMMSGQARAVYLFYRRWACYLFLSFLLCFLFRCFLKFLSPQFTGLRRTQEVKQHIWESSHKWSLIRGAFKYYFADFVRKGGGGTPKIRNPLFAENFVRKGGRGVPPKSVT